MRLMLKLDDPPLIDDIVLNVDNIPTGIDVIYHSSARRSRESAEIISAAFGGVYKLELRELEEVTFSADILTKEEYMENGGLLGCRKLLLKLWYNSSRMGESFQESFDRANIL